MSTLTEFDTYSEFLLHIDTLPSSELVVLYLYTPWTAFGTQTSDEMAALASQCSHTPRRAISFIGINCKKTPEVPKAYGIRTAPCVVFLRSDEMLDFIKGSDVAKICDAINRYMADEIVAVPLIPQPKEDSIELDDALVVRLTDLVKSAPVMAFIKGSPKSPQCRFSRRLVVLLREHDIEFESFDILRDQNVRQGLKEFGEWPTFPQLWVEGELVGGLEIIREEFSTDSQFLDRYKVGAVVNTSP